MNKTEKYIKNLINDIPNPRPDLQCPRPEECALDIRKSKSFSAKPKSLLSAKYIVAFSCFMLAVISLPVLARIPFVTERMQNLSNEETLKLADMTNQQNIEADLFSRPLTDEERTRMSSLWEEYISGNFPLDDITIVSGQETTNKVFYYNSDTGEFVLPDSRNLTDEELKQYIDFYFKRDYSLQSQQSVEILPPENTMNDLPANDYKIPEQHEKTITVWAEALGLHDVNPDEIRIQEIIHFDDQEDNYIYTYQSLNGTFSFTLQKNSLIVASSDSTTEDAKTAPFGNTADKLSPLTELETYPVIKKTLERIMDKDTTITSAWYLCATDKKGCLVEPVYSYMFETDGNTTCWLVSYKYGDVYPYRIWKTTTTWYFENLERGKMVNEKKGIISEVIPLDLEAGQPLLSRLH